MSKILKDLLKKNFIEKIQKIYNYNSEKIIELRNQLMKKQDEKIEIQIFNLIDENADIDEILNNTNYIIN